MNRRTFLAAIAAAPIAALAPFQYLDTWHAKLGPVADDSLSLWNDVEPVTIHFDPWTNAYYKTRRLTSL